MIHSPQIERVENMFEVGQQFQDTKDGREHLIHTILKTRQIGGKQWIYVGLQDKWQTFAWQPAWQLTQHLSWGTLRKIG